AAPARGPKDSRRRRTHQMRQQPAANRPRTAQLQRHDGTIPARREQSGAAAVASGSELRLPRLLELARRADAVRRAGQPVEPVRRLGEDQSVYAAKLYGAV